MAIRSEIQDLDFVETEESAGVNLPLDSKSDMQRVLEKMSQGDNTNINIQDIESPATVFPTDQRNIPQEVDIPTLDESEELFTKKYLSNNYSEEFKRSHNFQPKIDDSWETVDLPSRGIFYDRDQVRVRPLKVRHLCKIQGAVESKAISGILNVLDSCIDIDIRDLTQPDFRFLMYWWRLHSFPKTPLQLTWWSKYGNKNVSTIADTNLTVAVTTETRHRVQEYKQKGLTYPTVRELEYSVVNSLTPEDEWLFNHAQYYVGSDIDEKIENLDKASSTFKEDIEEFKKVFEHGIDENIYARDIHFDKEKYKNELNERLDYLKDRVHQLEIKDLPNLDNQNRLEIEAIYEAIGTLESELMSASKLQVAEEEKINIPFRMVNLLPDIQLTADTE